MTHKNENTVSAENKLYTASLGGKLMRNNVGVAFRDDGVPIRFGLGNESKKIHDTVYRSSDQVGILPVVITPEMVGETVGVFFAVEDKKSTWVYRESDNHSRLQNNFINLVNRLGGIACFATSTADIRNAIFNFHRRYTK